MVTKTESNEYNIGANASENPEEEKEDEAVGGPTAVTVNLVVDAHRLVETPFDKTQFMAYIKGFMKKVLDHLKANNPSRVDIFQKNIQPLVKKVLGNFNDYSFYTGESMDSVDGHVALMFYREDGITPVFWFFKDALKEEKV